MPISGPGDYPDFQRLQQQAGQLLVGDFNVAWTNDILVSGLYVGNYQSLGINLGSGGAAADITGQFSFSNDAANVQQIATRFLRTQALDNGVIACPVVGNFLQYIIQRSAYPAGVFRTFIIYGFSWPIDGADMLTSDRFQVFTTGAVAAGGTATIATNRYANSSVTLTASCTAGPCIVEYQQRQSSSFSYTTRLAVSVPTGGTAATAIGRVDCSPGQILFRNTSGAAQVITATLAWGPT